MESIRTYNTPNRTMTIEDALVAMEHGDIKVVFDKFDVKNPRQGVACFKVSFKVGSETITQFKFGETRFWSVRPMTEEQKATYQITKDEIFLSGTRNLQLKNNSGSEWKNSCEKTLFDFMDKFAAFFSQSLITEKKAKYPAPETKFKIKPTDEGNNGSWTYKVKIPSYQRKMQARFNSVDLIENNGEQYLSSGDKLDIPTIDDVVHTPLGKSGLIVWGIIRCSLVYVNAATGLMGQSFEVVNGNIYTDDRENNDIYADIIKSIKITKNDPALKAVIEKSKKIKQEAAADENASMPTAPSVSSSQSEEPSRPSESSRPGQTSTAGAAEQTPVIEGF